ncbi:hypothetical protein D3C80_1735290 [compost metagenome]
MVTRCGAARENQLGHCRLSRYRNHFRRQSCPYGVQVVQPIEQLTVLSFRYYAGEALVHMVVSIHQAWNDHFSSHVQNHIGLLRQRFARADLLDQVVFDEQATTLDLSAFTIHGHQKFSVLDQQSLRHTCPSPTWSLVST